MPRRPRGLGLCSCVTAESSLRRAGERSRLDVPAARGCIPRRGPRARGTGDPPVPWMVSNPIYFLRDAGSAAAPVRSARVACRFRRGFRGTSKRTAGPTGSVVASPEEVAFYYRLRGPGRGQPVRRGSSPSSRGGRRQRAAVTFTAAAGRPARVSVQLRYPRAGENAGRARCTWMQHPATSRSASRAMRPADRPDRPAAAGHDRVVAPVRRRPDQRPARRQPTPSASHACGFAPRALRPVAVTQSALRPGRNLLAARRSGRSPAARDGIPPAASARRSGARRRLPTCLGQSFGRGGDERPEPALDVDRAGLLEGPVRVLDRIRVDLQFGRDLSNRRQRARRASKFRSRRTAPPHQQSGGRPAVGSFGSMSISILVD